MTRNAKPPRSKFKAGLPKRKDTFAGKPKNSGRPAGKSTATHGTAAQTTAAQSTATQSDDDNAQRLQKVLAQAGVGSRRDCEQLILDGRVTVDGKVVSTLGSKVDPHQHEVRLDGEVLSIQRHVYYAVNKPVGIVCTNDDPAGRPRVVDLLPDINERLFTVGRLDLSSEGLMLVTNDGELANRLAHPRYGVEKKYHALVAGVPEPGELEKLRQGVHLAEGIARVVSVRIKQQQKSCSLLEIVLAEGKNREIRRVLARAGHKVLRLKRVALGPLNLKELEPGEVRRLTNEEVRALREASQGSAKPRRKRRPERRKQFAKASAPATTSRTSDTRKPESRKPEREMTDEALARRHPKPGGAAKGNGAAKVGGAAKDRGAPKRHSKKTARSRR